MKETIQAIVYERFYKKLRNKFHEEFIASTSKTPEDSRDVWEKSYNTKNINIAKDLFKINNEFYFHRKYDEEAKQHLEYGYPLYPITVGRKQFSLAMKYLLFGKVEKIDEFPELDFGINADWYKSYTTLLDQFMKQEFPEGLKEKREIMSPETRMMWNGELEKNILDFFSNRFKGHYAEPLQFEILDNLIIDFFKALSSHRMIDAWNLLSPKFRQYSIWEERFENFESSFKAIKSITNVRIFWYYFGLDKIQCTIRYVEQGVIWDYPNAIANINKEINDLPASKRDLEEIEEIHEQLALVNEKLARIYSFQKGYFDWKFIGYENEVDFLKMNNEQLLNPDFQKAAELAFHLLSEIDLFDNIFSDSKYSDRCGNYDREVDASITLDFEYGKWLIVGISIFPNVGLVHDITFTGIFSS